MGFVGIFCKFVLFLDLSSMLDVHLQIWASRNEKKIKIEIKFPSNDYFMTLVHWLFSNVPH